MPLRRRRPNTVRLLHSLAATLLLAAMPLAASADNVQDAETFFNNGLMHLKEGRSQMAADQFKRAVGANPKDPYSYKGLGLAYMQLMRYADAVSALRKAIEINPYFVDVRNDLGTALVLAGRRNEAKAEFGVAFNDSTNPTPEKAASNLGQVYLEEKNYTESANWYRTAVNRNKRYPDAYLGLADALQAMGNNDELVAYLEAGTKEVPESAGLHLALCQAYQRAGRLSDAKVQCEEAARREPVSPAGRRAADLLKTFSATR
jgi:tetratricopeptide (TPR) repeat protein